MTPSTFDPIGLAERLRGLNPRVRDVLSRGPADDYVQLMQQSFYLPDRPLVVKFTVGCKRVPAGFELSGSVMASDGSMIVVSPAEYIDSSLAINDLRTRVDQFVAGISALVLDRAEGILARLERDENGGAIG